MKLWLVERLEWEKQNAKETESKENRKESSGRSEGKEPCVVCVSERERERERERVCEFVVCVMWVCVRDERERGECV